MVDNKTLKDFETYMNKDQIAYQYTLVSSHRQKIPSKQFRPSKENFIAGLCSLPSNSPIN